MDNDFFICGGDGGAKKKEEVVVKIAAEKIMEASGVVNFVIIIVHCRFIIYFYWKLLFGT